MTRIVAGRFGGRRLRVPKGDATRPTADRVKEALFSILGDLSGAVVLDAFAGTGGLGVEALSRGAVRAVFVEAAPPALSILRQNLASLGLGAAEAVVVDRRIERSRQRLAELGPFDLVLADPPYADIELAVRAVEALAEDGAVSQNARVVLEHASSDEPTVVGWTLSSRKRYGDTALSFFDRVSA